MSQPRSLEDRAQDAIARSHRTLVTYQRSRVAVDSSRWLITSSRVVLDRERPSIAGASGDPPPDESAVRSRLRSFIDTGVLPAEAPEQMWSGTCFQAHRCIVCGSNVEIGEPEFEWENPAGLPLFFHRRCVGLWKENGASSG
jgi:hypothetical protein